MDDSINFPTKSDDGRDASAHVQPQGVGDAVAQRLVEEVRVEFRYDVIDLKAFVRLGPPELSDQVLRAALGQAFEEFLRVTRDMLVIQRGKVADVSVDKELQASMGVLANRFVSMANATEEISAFGILLRSSPDIKFRRI